MLNWKLFMNKILNWKSFIKILNLISLNFWSSLKSLVYNTIYTAPIFETLIGLSVLIIRLTFNNTVGKLIYFRFEAPFYDTGSMISLLICLEHLFVCYYLIIILVMVYWSLYTFVLDFSGWTFKHKNFNYLVTSAWVETGDIFYIIYLNIYKFFLTKLLEYKEYELLYSLYFTHVNFSADASIPLYIWGLFPFYFNKIYFNNKNLINVFVNFLVHFDFLGRSMILLNSSILKFFYLINIINESIYLLNKKGVLLEELSLKKKFNNFLYYSLPNAYFFSNIRNMHFYLQKNDITKLSFSNWIYYLRVIYNNIFKINQFKHSGIFEAIWAAFPTFIIICILIPSLILLYSFEDILNPRMSVKVVGNQWYWIYEFDNWIQYNKKEIEIESNLYNYNTIYDKSIDIFSNELCNEVNIKNIYTNFSFNSVIIDTKALEVGSKRLLEVDNRLVLSTNVPIRFLVSSADVLHAFAVPELGFKVDAVPGRINQILLFISKPGVYYGQCSELCGISHGFMPIVIQSVSPNNYLSYIESIHKGIDLI